MVNYSDEDIAARKMRVLVLEILTYVSFSMLLSKLTLFAFFRAMTDRLVTYFAQLSSLYC